MSMARRCREPRLDRVGRVAVVMASFYTESQRGRMRGTMSELDLSHVATKDKRKGGMREVLEPVGHGYLESYRVKSTVDENIFSCHAAGEIAEEIDGGFADFVAVDIALERGFALGVGEHFVDPSHCHGG